LPDGALRELARREQDTLNRIAALNQLLARLASAPADERLNKVIDQMRAEVERLRKEHTELRVDIRTHVPAGKDGDSVALWHVNQPKRGSPYREFTCAHPEPGSAQQRILGEKLGRCVYAFPNKQRCTPVSFGDQAQRLHQFAERVLGPLRPLCGGHPGRSRRVPASSCPGVTRFGPL
jgi:hypothetical protein